MVPSVLRASVVQLVWVIDVRVSLVIPQIEPEDHGEGRGGAGGRQGGLPGDPGTHPGMVYLVGRGRMRDGVCGYF